MWFQDEVIRHRFGLCWTWMLQLQFILIIGFHFLIKIITWQPWVGMQEWIYALFSLRALLYHLILCFSCSFYVVLHIKFYSAERFVYSNRAETILAYMAPRRIFHWICLVALGLLNMYCYLSYFGGGVQSENFFESFFQWNSWIDYSFITFYGAYTGAIFSWKYFKHDWYYLQFPLSLNEPVKFSLLKSRLYLILKESFKHSVHFLHLYYFLYILFGSFLVEWLVTTFDFHNSRDSEPSVFSILSFKLLITSVILSTIMYFTWNLYIFVFGMFSSERYEFLIDATNEIDKPKVLCKSMTCSDFKLLQYLAFMDFRWLAQYSTRRRERIFSISQPGGHPHQWHSLSCICMTSLSQFLNNLKKLTIIEKNNGFNMHAAKVDPKASLDSPVTAYAERIQDYFRKKHLFRYFFDDFTDVNAVRLFSSCQLEIWTIEALGYLISASHKEDKFGVLQQTLPKILCLLIDLKVCEEKLPIGLMNSKKIPRNLQKGVLERSNLKCVLEATLYRIVLTFKKDIREVILPEECHRYLEKYLRVEK